MSNTLKAWKQYKFAALSWILSLLTSRTYCKLIELKLAELLRTKQHTGHPANGDDVGVRKSLQKTTQTLKVISRRYGQIQMAEGCYRESIKTILYLIGRMISPVLELQNFNEWDGGDGWLLLKCTLFKKGRWVFHLECDAVFPLSRNIGSLEVLINISWLFYTTAAEVTWPAMLCIQFQYFLSTLTLVSSSDAVTRIQLIRFRLIL